MSEYNTGTVAVTNSSTTVVGTSTTWSTEVAAGDIFTIVASGVSYIVGSVTDDTHIELTGAYAGTTDSGLSYTISTSFTSPDSIPYPQLGDTQPATILARMAAKIQDLFTALGTAADEDIGTSGATVPLLSTANTWSLEQDFSANGFVTPSGTFSPTLLDSSFSDAEGQTYSTQSGVWVELTSGVYYVEILLSMSSLGTLTTTDNAYIGGFPFAFTSAAPSLTCGGGFSLNLTAANSSVVLNAVNGQTYGQLRQWDATAGTGTVKISEVSASGQVRISGVYK